MKKRLCINFTVSRLFVYRHWRDVICSRGAAQRAICPER